MYTCRFITITQECSSETSQTFLIGAFCFCINFFLYFISWIARSYCHHSEEALFTTYKRTDFCLYGESNLLPTVWDSQGILKIKAVSCLIYRTIYSTVSQIFKFSESKRADILFSPIDLRMDLPYFNLSLK